MVVGVTEVELIGFGPLEIEMRVVLPGKSHTTMDLYSFARDESIRIACIGLGNGSK